MITKKFIHFARFDLFLSKKLSADKDNTTYTIGLDGEVLEGDPDISYQSIVYIKDAKCIFTHGQLYDSSGTAIKLKSPITINGTLFDGSSDIVTETWGKPREIKISDSSGTNSGVSVSIDGSNDVVLSLPQNIDANVTNDSEGNNIVETYSTKKELIQSLDDLSTFYVYSSDTDEDPTLTSYPASEWTTELLLNTHAGDFYVTSTGRVFQFYNDPDTGWYWKEITDYYLYECQKSLKIIEDKVNLGTTWDEPQTIPEIGEVYVRGELTTDTYYLDILLCNQNLSYRLEGSDVTIHLPFIYNGSWTRTQTNYLTRIPHFIKTDELSKVVGKTIIITNESTSSGTLNIVIGDNSDGIDQTLSVEPGNCCVLKFCTSIISGNLYYHWEGEVASPVLTWS